MPDTAGPFRPSARSMTLAGVLGLLAGAGGAALATSGVASDPTTTRGDLIVHGADAGLERLGTEGAADGGVLTVAGGTVQWAAASGGSSSTALYASDCTAEAGSESASISGTGASSTFTLTASNIARVYGSGGATAARIVCPIPADAVEVEVEIGVTAASGVSTSGYRFLGVGWRDAANGGAPAQLFGGTWNDVSQIRYGGFMNGANDGVGPIGAGHTIATDSWLRVAIRARGALVLLQTGGGTGGARPTSWRVPTNVVAIPSGTWSSPATEGASAVAIWLQSFGNGGATSVTGSLRVRVRTW